MKGKKVEIYLNTPLFRCRYTMIRSEEQLIENAVHLSGKIVEEYEGGFGVQVKALYSVKHKQDSLPFSTILVPLHKIDFMVFS